MPKYIHIAVGMTETTIKKIKARKNSWKNKQTQKSNVKDGISWMKCFSSEYFSKAPKI